MTIWKRPSKTQIRALSAAVTAVVISTGLAACGGTTPAPDSKTAGEVTLMGYSGVVEDNYTKAVIEPFEKKYPNIKVNYVPGESASQMLGELRSQKGDPSADIALFDISVAGTGNKEGIFQPLDPAKVPNMADIDPRGQVKGNFGPAATFDNLVLLYNTEKVTKKPTSWNALWGKNVAGSVVIDAPPDLQGNSLTIITDKMEGADYKDTIKPAVKRLAELAPSVDTWKPNPDPYTMITNGSASMGIGWNARAQFYAEESNGKLGVAIPDEGSVFQTNSINLVKGSDSPEAAQTFINHALSPEAQESFAEQMYYAPTNKKAKVSEAVADRTATSPERLANIIDVDWTYVAAHNDEWTDIWRREILSR